MSREQLCPMKQCEHEQTPGLVLVSRPGVTWHVSVCCRMVW